MSTSYSSMKHAAQTNLTYRYAKIAFCVKKRTGKRKENEMWGLTRFRRF